MMQISMKGIFDEETRKQFKEAALAEVRGLARSVVSKEFNAEIERVVSAYAKASSYPGTKLESTFRDQVKQHVNVLLTGAWSEISQMIQKHVQQASDDVVAAKLATKTVWEAKHQDAYIRKIVKEELKRMLTDK